jgi:hypothetical protein
MAGVDSNIILKDSKILSPNEIEILIEKKISYFKDIIQKTILYVQKNKLLDILGITDVNNYISILYDLNIKVNEINSLSKTKENVPKNPADSSS